MLHDALICGDIRSCRALHSSAVATWQSFLESACACTARKTVHEINYLSAACFADNPRLSWKEFVCDTLGPRLGGAALAGKYVRILTKSGATPGDLKLVKSVLGKCAPNGHRRWMWLCELLYRRIDHHAGGRRNL